MFKLEKVCHSQTKGDAKTVEECKGASLFSLQGAEAFDGYPKHDATLSLDDAQACEDLNTSSPFLLFLSCPGGNSELCICHMCFFCLEKGIYRGA
jgi:hypothetical protein